MARDLTEGAGLALRVLGGFEVCVGDRAVSLPANAQRVLGYLAVTGAESRREVLAAHLWSWTSQARAQANLRTALWRVRQASAQLITSKRDVVRLGVGVKVDYTEMMSCALRLIDTTLAPDDALITSARLLEADLLPGWDEDWLLIDRERHRQLRMHALEALSRRLVDCGEYARAVDAAYAAIAVEPLYESAQATLIAAHLAEGNRTEAIRQFTAFRRLLYDETGLAPSPSLFKELESALAEAAHPQVAPKQRLLETPTSFSQQLTRSRRRAGPGEGATGRLRR
jgi:DNA-binding SARP family transcriptional activator